jgi:hypothetical protein
MKLLELSQNNSGGYFYDNDDVSTYIIIVANNYKEAMDKFDTLDSGIEDWCSCCGERWNIDWQCDEDMEEFDDIESYINENLYIGVFSKKCIVHYKDYKEVYVAKDKKWLKLEF